MTSQFSACLKQYTFYFLLLILSLMLPFKKIPVPTYVLWLIFLEANLWAQLQSRDGAILLLTRSTYFSNADV